MMYFWNGFEKQAAKLPKKMPIGIALKEVTKHLGGRIKKHMTPSVTVKHKLDKESLRELKKTMNDMNVNVKSTNLDKWQPKHLVIPAAVGSGGIAAGAVVGKKMATKATDVAKQVAHPILGGDNKDDK